MASQLFLIILNMPIISLQSYGNIPTQMGCEACKVGLQHDFFPGSASESTSTATGDSFLLTHNDRNIWSDNLTIEGHPEVDFWDRNRDQFHECFPQIKKDIPRTYPSQKLLAKRANIHIFESLLKKFALYFPKIGYTQGLNFVAGYLTLSGFSEQKGFEILVGLAMQQNFLLIGLYEDEFPLNQLYCRVFWKLLESRLPKTAAKILLAKVPNQSWIFQWFMSFFLYSFPVSFVKRLMDYIICKKGFAMVSIAIGIVNCLKYDIQSLNDLDEFDFYEYCENLKDLEFCQAKINIDMVISYANSITKREIHEALKETKLKENIYYVYFLKEEERKEIWKRMNEKLCKERKLFLLNPKSPQYKRDRNTVEHLERFLLKKSRLYRSFTDSRFSSKVRASNFTVELEESREETKNEEHEKISHFSKKSVKKIN